MTASLAAGVMEATLRTVGAAERVRVPTLVLHGEDDPLCPPSGSADFHSRLPHSEVAGSEIRTYPNLRHEILNEPERKNVYADILDWVEKREAEAPDG
jgi:alpha-beta hydrolase superfamily lysophospholipase